MYTYTVGVFKKHTLFLFHNINKHTPTIMPTMKTPIMPPMEPPIMPPMKPLFVSAKNKQTSRAANLVCKQVCVNFLFKVQNDQNCRQGITQLFGQHYR